ncbi:MAG: glycosyltransferase family 1 protein [Flavobacteriia bacterium]|nr:glycosyltransferase family 1 protein [Flavobacteriia bacterium]
MKILLGYSYYPYPNDVRMTVESWVKRLQSYGHQVEAYPLTVSPPNHPIWWERLDKMWQLGDKELLNHYAKLARKLEDFDVFLNWNGINIHPEFVSQLTTFNVYGCFDDPESSHRLSRPVAAAYDLSMIGNVAEIETYKSWGVKNVKFWPIGFMQHEFDSTLTEDRILSEERNIDLAMLCEKKYYPERIKRLNQYASFFPNGEYYGAGWPKGFLEEKYKIPLYLKTKIGPNFHNSTGPINYRTYTLPANGVMQICDNKSHLGQLFELDKEVVGFEDVKEAIDKTRYYLEHDEERKMIAVAGWRRALKDYNENAVFGLVERYVDEITNGILLKKVNKTPEYFLKKHRRNKTINRLKFRLKNMIVTQNIPQNE